MSRRNVLRCILALHTLAAITALTCRAWADECMPADAPAEDMIAVRLEPPHEDGNHVLSLSGTGTLKTCAVDCTVWILPGNYTVSTDKSKEQFRIDRPSVLSFREGSPALHDAGLVMLVVAAAPALIATAVIFNSDSGIECGATCWKLYGGILAFSAATAIVGGILYLTSGPYVTVRESAVRARASAGTWLSRVEPQVDSHGAGLRLTWAW